MASGQYFKRQQLTSARLLSLVNIAGTYDNGPENNGIGATLTIGASSLVLDGTTVEENDRLTLSRQTSRLENGLYRASGVGTDVVLTRSEDFHEVSQMEAGYFWPIQTGVQNGGGTAYMIDPVPNKVGVDNVRIFSDNMLPSDDFIAFNVNVTSGLLAGGNQLTLLPGGSVNQYRVRYMYVNAGGTAFSGGGGNRDFFIFDGTTFYSFTIPGSTFQQTAQTIEWGRGIDFPYPTASVVGSSFPTAVGANFRISYSGGTTDYTAGNIVVSGLANQIA